MDQHNTKGISVGKKVLIRNARNLTLYEPSSKSSVFVNSAFLVTLTEHRLWSIIWIVYITTGDYSWRTYKTQTVSRELCSRKNKSKKTNMRTLEECDISGTCIDRANIKCTLDPSYININPYINDQMDNISGLWHKGEVERKYIWRIANIFQILKENIQPHIFKK